MPAAAPGEVRLAAAGETRVWLGRWNDEDCVFGICKDLSAEQEALQKFDRLFRLNPCPMAVSGVADLAFTDVNDAWLRLLGHERSEVVGRTARDRDLFVDREAHRRVGDLLLAAGRVVDVDVQVRRKDGSVLYGVFSGEVIESQGTRHSLTVMVDHTEAKQAREALVRAARISETVGLAVRSTAHELQALLEVISAAVARLDEELPAADKHRTVLASIEDAARRSADLTGRLAGSGQGGSGE